MRGKSYYTVLFLCFLFLGALPAGAAVQVQCPCLDDPAAQNVITANGNIECNIGTRQISCKHVIGGDGFAKMADAAGTELYTFGFSDGTGISPDVVIANAEHNAQQPAPLIKMREGTEFYLTLSTVPMRERPDLFDAHTVHFHGFPNAAPIFDGEPMAALAINGGASLTYYYKVPTPGTYMYHCHVEASEHMQMGMLGNLYVTPLLGPSFAYNHATTGFDIEYFIQIIGFDPDFHNANQYVQILPFAAMKDTYMMLNGRGYPDTVDPRTNTFPAPLQSGKVSQQVPSLITANPGQRVLLRISNLSTVHFSTITIPGIPMTVVGKDAMILRSAGDQSLYYTTNTLTLGGGQSIDVILDTTGIASGTYFLHTTVLDELSNNTEDFGGLMTEIVIN